MIFWKTNKEKAYELSTDWEFIMESSYEIELFEFQRIMWLIIGFL